MLRAVAVVLGLPAAMILTTHSTASQPAELLRITMPAMENVERALVVDGSAFQETHLSALQLNVVDGFLTELQPVILGAVIVTGYADQLEISKDPQLPEKRAAAAKVHLISRGVDARLVFSEAANKSDHNRRFSPCMGIERTWLIECVPPSRGILIELVGVKPLQPKPRVPRPAGV